MKTKTQHSAHGVFAVSIVMAIVLGTLQQTLVAVPADVQASSGGSSVHHASPEDSVSITQLQISSWRDLFVRSLQHEIDSFSAYPQTGHTVSTVSQTPNSGMNIQTTDPAKKIVDKPCIPSHVSDISGSLYQSEIQWAIDNCLVQGYSNQKFYPNNDLTHQAMITIAQRAGYSVNLMRGANEVVTKSELLKFIDYLQDSGQIGLVPSVKLTPIVKRGQYIKLIRLLSTKEIKIPVLAPTHTGNTTVMSMDTPKTTTSGEPNHITVAQFKTILNQSLATPLAIQVYDDKVILTEDIMKALINSSQGTTIVSPVGTGTTGKIDLGINKEMLKESLSRIIQKM